MPKASITRRSQLLLLTILLTIGSAGQAAAQGFISPFLGYNFGGDAGCPEITNCEDKHANWGVSFGALGGILGFEAEFGHTNDFLGESSIAATDVNTFMANFMLAPKFGPVQPYGLAGAGLIRTSVESAGSDEDDNQFGYDLGGGLIVFFSSHVGVRGDVRYFHSFEIIDGSKFPSLPIRETNLDFGRFSLAMMFKF